MSDETIRSVTVDENQPVANLMVLICTKLGITNHDEYSLIATGKHTINGRRRERQDGRIIDQKMEQLKKKLKTDEDLAWVDHSKTLDEQEIHEQDVVLLRRRFFYSDHNVDSRDPIQLGLLYVQTRDAILSGNHPVTLDGACKFAGIQCQAQLGDFMEGKTTRPGYFNLRDYLPADYSKVKHIERKIYQEHKKYYGTNELEAKAKYVSEARSLPTYGVTFFLVKERVQGKNKLVPRLLGITKDCVMRVDADSKAILKTWPLTTVKRWAASMNSFTLDFGDYSDSYYSVQTSEGEQISQLIAGYIDIILKRRKAKDHFGIEGDEGATMVEDSVAPSRATIIQNQPSLARPPSAAPSTQDLTSVAGPTVEKQKLEQGPHVEPPEYRPAFEVRGKAEIGYEAGPLTQYVTNYELSLPQRDLQDRLEQAQDAIEEAQKVLDKQQPEVDSSRYEQREVDDKKRELSKQFADINAATAQLVSLSAIPEEELNYPALNQAVETVASNLPVVAKDIKLVASLMDDEESGDRLIDAARRLCKAFSDLLNAAEPGPTVPRQSLISAASRVGDATQALLFTINNGEEEEERETADQLLSLAKSVASSAAGLVLLAKDVASTCREKELRDLVVGSATQCALATSQMVATAKIVAPSIHDPSCQRRLVDACHEVQRAVQGIQSTCQRAIRDDQLLCNVNDSVDRVNQALQELMDHVSRIRRQQRTTTTSTRTVINKATVNDSSSVARSRQNHNRDDSEHEDNNNSELVNQARTLARATAQLIEDIKPQHKSADQPRQQSVYDSENYHQSSTSHRQSPYGESERVHRFHSQPQQQNAPAYDQQHSDQRTNKTTTTTTITTTLYDEDQQRLQQTHGISDRPLSIYDTESGQTATRPDEYESRYTQQQQYSSEQQVISSNGEPGPGQDGLPEATISGIVGDLETTIMFASAGTLRAHDEHDNYLYHRENVLRSAKALVEDTRPLVASAASNESQLAQAAQESVYTMSRLAETVKSSAASLGPNQAESQVSLIRSVKDVAVSLSDLIGSTKSALGCEPSDPMLMHVKDSAKNMVSGVTTLLKTVKSVEEEQQRGLRAIEAALEAIEQELDNYGNQRLQMLSEDSGKREDRLRAAEELVRSSRPVTMATAKTIHAGSSGIQDDAIVAANMGRKAIVDLLASARVCSQHAHNYELRVRVQEAGRNCVVDYKHLLELLHKIFQHPSIASANPEIKQELINQSKSIANCVTEIANCAELVRASSSSADNWQQQSQNRQDLVDDPNDPTVIAESELLGAASSIDAAAKKLENLKPRVTSVKVSS